MDNEDRPAPEPETPAVDLRGRLLRERNALLDMSTRNRLLNIPMRTQNVRTIEIVDEKAAEILRLLGDGKAMTFLPGVALSEAAKAELEPGDTDTGDIPQPEDDTVDEKGRAARHVDLKLQTRLTSEGLQKRLFDIWYDARTLEQEQGVNILYLALGLLKWYDDDKAENARYAPLVLMPVLLERSTAAEKFRLKGRGEPPSPNLTLQAKMRADFDLLIEDFPDEDDVDLTAYAARVAESVGAHKRWEVLPDAMVLGFFSFAKFLMYRDLDPETWPETQGVDDHALIRALLHDGFAPDAPLIADGDDIDAALPPAERMHVVDADSSQTVAIAEAAGGRTLVIKGPPGTGKSQTITNIIAAAAARGRKVLFVAEKMAALDVVHRRLQQAGLGPLTLELHSNKVNKRAVLDELKRTKDAAARGMPEAGTVTDKLDLSTEALNGFAERLHTPLLPSGLSPQQILGKLARWHRAGEPGRNTPLDGAVTWSVSDVESRRDAVSDIAERAAGLGPIPEHPWRGVSAEAFDPSARDQLARDITRARDDLNAAMREAGVAVRLFGAPEPRTIADLDLALAHLQLTPLPRDADRQAFTDAAWRDTKALAGLVETGQLLTRLREETGRQVNEAGLSAQYDAIRTDIVTKGRDLFRFLDGGYKRSIALLASYMRTVLPKDPDERLKLIDAVIRLQKTEATFAAKADIGRAFGGLWHGADSNWQALDNVLRWRQSHHALPEAVWPRLTALTEAQLAEADRTRQSLYAALSAYKSGFDTLGETLKLDETQAFGVEAPTIRELNDRLTDWLNDMEALSRFIAFASRGRALAGQGVAPLVAAIHDGTLEAADILPAFDGAYAYILRDVLFQAWPELKAFDGDGHNRAVDAFRQQDVARIELAKAQIAASHSQGRPNASGGIGPLGVLNGEMAKKRGHLPIRQLLDKAGPAIQQLKPVFMMSPLSVAQFLKPGGLTFDLLVMDEASQIEPVDALGAIARVEQLVVVGDERQLPPTSFFKKLTGEEIIEEDDAGLLNARDTESILDLCLAKGAPYRMLNWHYRSKHQSLIAVSNREFYDGRLLIVPSPYDAVSGMGLKFHKLTNAPYDRGGTRTNPVEARTVAEAVIAHARQNPEQSLGVAAFSVSQRQAILHELELLRRNNPDTEDFFSEAAAEPFFVKNLENIQGDERDVIFISVGYGKTAEGTLAHNFGPLSASGGERRLNVLISRAKTRCEVFCNFTGADIDLEKTEARGVAALKLFLTFAETGRFDAAAGEGPAAAAELEAEIALALRNAGYEVKTQIGASGFRVDLAVADPEVPGRFLLGIDCDGPQFRDARTARDRDRLRQQVLAAHGWVLHRVWSADWYLRPKSELARIEAAMAAARAQWADRDEAEDQPQPVIVAPQAMADIVAPVAVVAEAAPAYVEASFPVDTGTAPEMLSSQILAESLVRIVTIEGPVHGDEIAARVRTLWGVPRAGARLKTAVADALRVAAGRGDVFEADGFYTIPDRSIIVRDRSQVSAGLKKPELLPPAELDLAILTVVTENFGATRGDLIVAVARRLGFAATGTTLRARLSERIDHLLARGRLNVKGDLFIAAG